MRMGLNEGTRCPDFQQVDDDYMKSKQRKHFAWSENDQFGETYGCKRGECDKDEEWQMMFSQPRQVELDDHPPRVTEGSESGGVEGSVAEVNKCGEGAGEVVRDTEAQKETNEGFVVSVEVVETGNAMEVLPTSEINVEADKQELVQDILTVLDLTIRHGGGRETTEESPSTKKCMGLSSTSDDTQPQELRNLPPVPFAYIVKEVPSVERTLELLRGVQEGGSGGQLGDLSNPYLRILIQEIPYLIHEYSAEGRAVLENTVVDRLEQLRVYQLNLKRAHMGIGELVFQGCHYPHVQKIQDLVEYPQTEEQHRQEAIARDAKAEQVAVADLDTAMQRRFGAIQQEGRSVSPGEVSSGRCCESSATTDDEEDETDELYFEEDEDEFLDYYSDMQYLRQSEQQILAIFTDHIMNSMLDDVLAVVQRNLPTRFCQGDDLDD